MEKLNSVSLIYIVQFIKCKLNVLTIKDKNT